jgi:hypothetical protein
VPSVAGPGGDHVELGYAARIVPLEAEFAVVTVVRAPGPCRGSPTVLAGSSKPRSRSNSAWSPNLTPSNMNSTKWPCRVGLIRFFTRLASARTAAVPAGCAYSVAATSSQAAEPPHARRRKLFEQRMTRQVRQRELCLVCTLTYAVALDPSSQAFLRHPGCGMFQDGAPRAIRRPSQPVPSVSVGPENSGF